MREFGMTGTDANAGALSEREWMWVDNRIHWWLQEKMTALQILGVTKVGSGQMSHEYNKYVELGSPIFTYTFEEESLVKLVKTPTRAAMLGIRLDVELSKLDQDANGQYGSQSLDAGMRKLEQFIDRAIYRGSDVLGKRTDSAFAATVQGLFTTTGQNTLGANGGGADSDDNMTAAGDYPHTVKKMIALLLEDNHYGPYTLVMTRGCYLQAIKNRNTTTGLTDLDELLRIPAPQAMIKVGERIPSAVNRIVTTPNLLAAAETNATGELLLLDTNKDYVDLLVNYEPTRINLYGGGLTNRLTQQFVLLTGLCTRFVEPTAACISVTLTNDVLSA